MPHGRTLWVELFQFTHPVWGATISLRTCLNVRLFQFTHPVWGATSAMNSSSSVPVFQFTHPVWGATAELRKYIGDVMFQFTHPVWGATSALGYQEIEGRVSIHAPRVGCDLCCGVCALSYRRFNSRTPCGVRPLTDKEVSVQRACFNSRTPCGVRR